ncbi:MAG: DnaJ domain [Pseudonocardiales bacterium]|jgi:DnaJ-domain-containing protein 1|nr:DnaJ domain [Pseudonocardiales bacterium]
MSSSSRAPDHCGAHQRAADLYAVLGVSPDAEIGELASAYRRRLRQLHPDPPATPRRPTTRPAPLAQPR